MGQQIENWTYQFVKSAWQNDDGFYEVRNGFCSDEVPIILSEEDLDKLIDLMGEDYSWIIVDVL